MPLSRRDFLFATAAGAAARPGCAEQPPEAPPSSPPGGAAPTAAAATMAADVVIVGGSTGGVAAALAACRAGAKKVVLTEETAWVGGQLTAQLVPPDENKWIESGGASRSYRDFRAAVRRVYRTRTDKPLRPAYRDRA